jgi:uncharacterized protein
MKTEGNERGTACSVAGDAVAAVPLTIKRRKKFVPSRFNAHTTAQDGTLLLYNAYTGHNCAFPPTSAPKVKRYLSQAGSEEPLDKLGTYLFEHGYIVDKTADEGARWDVRYGQQQYRRDLLELILLSSEECNFRCIYCCQEFKRETMLPHVRRGVLNLVKQRIERLWAVNVSWFGGEPLLGYEAIEEMAPEIQRMARENGAQYVSGITTNGYLLYPERSRKMLQWGITSYQISIDGAGELHDQHRPLKGGGSTYEQILDNVTAMKDYPEQFRVYLRTNFDQTSVDHLMPLFEAYKERLKGDPRFIVRLEPVGKWGGANDDQLQVCGVEEQIVAVETLKQQARSLGLNAEAGPVAALEAVPKAVCYAARPYSFIVGADGKLMKCTVVLDNLPNNIVGEIEESGNLKLDEDRFAEWVAPHYKHDKLCNKCFFVPVCQGGFCPLPRVAENEHRCPSARLKIREVLQNVYKERKELPQARSVRL